MGWPFGERVIVQRPTVTQDGDGNDVSTFDPANFEPHEGVAIGPGEMLLLDQGQHLTVDGLHAYFKPSIALTDVDQIDVLTGLHMGLYDMDGQPKHYRSPLTGTSVTDAKLKKATG